MKSSKYEFYACLLIIELAFILFMQTAKFLPDSTLVLFTGLFLILSGIAMFVYWDIFWYRNVTKTGFKGVVSAGIYGHVRHPLLLSVILTFFGVAVFFNSLQGLFAAILSSVVMLLGMKKEERELVNKYGKEYLRYQKKVPYKLIPGVI